MADAFDDFVKSNTQTPGNPNPGVPTSTPASTGGGDPFDKFVAVQSQQVAPSTQSIRSISQSSGGDEFDKFVSGNSNSNNSRTGITEHDESDRFSQDDPGDNWLEKSWSFLNKPLTESLFGWGQYRQGAGGFERAIEKTASGLTSPLSLGLLAAFAPAGLAEGVAGSALKEGLTEGGTLLGEDALDGITAAQKVEGYAKSVDAAEKARIAGKSIQEAVEKNGLPYQEFLNMGQYLRNQGMTETDILGESFARRAASQGLRKVGVTPGQALRVAKGAETLVNVGFGAQMIHGAIYAFPKAFDLLSQGDYDGAAEYLTEGSLSTVFGTLGLAHGLHSISDIIPSLNEKNALPLSDETEAINKVFAHMSGDVTASQVQIADRKRSHLIGLMEIAGIDVPAGLRNKIEFTPENQTRLTELQNKLKDQPSNLSQEQQKAWDWLHSSGYTEFKKAKGLGSGDEFGSGELSGPLQKRFGLSPDDSYDLAKQFVKEGKEGTTLLETDRDELRNLIEKQKNQNATTFGGELKSAVSGILASKADREKLAQAQKNMFMALDSGNDRVLAHQKLKALAAGTNQEDWVRDVLGYKFDAPQRTVEDIANEEKNSVLAVKTTALQGKEKITDLANDISLAVSDLKKATPETAPDIQTRLEKLREQMNDLQLNQQDLDKRYSEAKDWEDPERQEEAFKRLYDHHVQAIKEAAESTPWDSPRGQELFHEKVRALGNYPLDLSLIESKYPHFKEGLPDVPGEYDKYSGVGNRYKGPVDIETIEDLKNDKNKSKELREAAQAVFESVVDSGMPIDDAMSLYGTTDLAKILGGKLQKTIEGSFDVPGNRVYPPDITDSEKRTVSNGISSLQSKLKLIKKQIDSTQETAPEYGTLMNKYGVLAEKLQSLENKYRKGVTGNYLGEVNKLPDGSRILYVPLDTLKKIDTALHMKKLNLGEQIPKQSVDYAIRKLENSKNPDRYELMKLLDSARSANGDVVLSRDAEAHPGKIYRRLHTIREELTHSWQGSLSRTIAGEQLSALDYSRLASLIPKGMIKHLNDLRYDTKPTTRVVEASAKMMAVRDLSSIGVTPEEAASFLHQYFAAVKAKHGEAAFDTLKHTTVFAKRLKEEFLNEGRESRPEPSTGPGESEGALAGVGEGGGGGTPQGPPGGEPPQPPEPFDWRKYFGPESGGILGELFKTEPWQDGPQHPGLPANLVERVNKAKARKYTPAQIEYVQSILRAYAHVAEGLTPDESRLYKAMRDADDDNWASGYNNGIIHSIVDNHIHHIWGDDPKKGYPAAAQANSGAFAINATQARHRSWSTAFEGILDGRQLKVHDPSAIIANDADQIAQTSAHRKALELLAKGRKQPDGSFITLKDPEGMPILTFRGMGREVPGEDGSTASILVNPNIVKNILMQPADIKRLTDSGLLDTYLKDGRVVDRTPQVGQGNVKEWIAATQKKLQKLSTKNPLLGGPEQRLQHEAGWGQLQLFAKNQAQKITEYLDEALSRLQEGAIDSKGNYKALSESDKPEDISIAKYLGAVLHGKNRRITPADFVRLKEYLERNRNYAEGLSGDGSSQIRPHEIARLIGQEKQHLDPELVEYLNNIHDHFAERDSEGNWTRKGLNTSVYHIAHAAENTEYPQLMKDLADLKHVDNTYTSINPITQSIHKEEALKLLKEINERQPKQYLWAPKSHIPIDHPSFHGYKWMASAADGTPTLAESDMAVSRHYYKYILNRLGLEPSWLRQKEGLGKITEPLLRGGAQVKSTILSGSPFHVIQIALRALMLHVNPFVRPNPISTIDEPFALRSGKTSTLRKGVENSLTLFTDKNAAEDYGVGVASHGGLVSKIPIYGPFTDQIHDFLFNRFIPSVKADSYKKMYEQYADAHPEWSEDAVAYHAAQHTNNAYGGVNWREMGRSATTQDWFNLVALAPDWLESEMRFGASLFNGYGIGPAKYKREEGKNFTRTQVGQAAVALWTVARVLNKLHSGSPHYETPFGLVVKDKDGRDVEYSVRTLPTDILHAATDPYGFLVGRTSPLARTGEELVTGRNQYGQKLTASEKYVDMISNLSPIWGQAGFKKLTNLSTASDVGGFQQLVKAAGGTAAIHRTPAELTAANLASERSEEGSINPAQIARHRLLIQLEENVRSGKIKAMDLQTMVDHGSLPEADAKTVIKVAKETTGLDPEQARMYSRTSRLDFTGADQVYKDANPSEKTILHNLVVKKAKAYIRKSLKDETPSTRALDPMFRQARRYAPLIPETTEAPE